MARQTASSMVDLPAPVGPVMAKRPAPFSGSAVRSMEKGWTRLASPSPAMRRMRMRSGLVPRRGKGPQMYFARHGLMAGNEGLGEEIERIDVLELGRRWAGEVAAADSGGGAADDLRRRRHPDRKGAGDLVHLAADSGCRAVNLDRHMDEGAQIDRKLRIEAH